MMQMKKNIEIFSLKPTATKLKSGLFAVFIWAKTSVADPEPDPKDPHHFAGSGSIIFFMDPDPDPDLNLAHHHSPPPSHLIFHI